MEGAYPTVSGCLVQEKRLEILANNLANINTIGYKEDRPVFQTYIEDSLSTSTNVPAIGNIIPERDYVVFTGVKTVFAQGESRSTNNPLDLAINGDGFFVVETKQGRAYTRKGNFTLNEQGMLVTQDGLPVLGEGGKIVLPEGQIVIDSTGNIFVDDKQVDTISLVDFPKPYPLKKIGSSLFVPRSPLIRELEPSGTTIQQGYLELSNVQPIKAMVEMIDIMRAYEAYHKTIQTFNEDTLKSINEIGRL
jgi:flagellar basal-body rod protein FlgG